MRIVYRVIIFAGAILLILFAVSNRETVSLEMSNLVKAGRLLLDGHFVVLPLTAASAKM